MILKFINHEKHFRALNFVVNMTFFDYLKKRLIAYLDKIRFFIFNVFNIFVNKFIIFRKFKCLDFN